jgi:hypothetical protein
MRIGEVQHAVKLPVDSDEPQDNGESLKSIIALLMVASFASVADGQVRRRVPRPVVPSVWGSLSVGLFNANDVSDGKSESTWDFGRASTPQFRAALEAAVSNTIAIGAEATYANVPFTFRGNACGACAAHMDVVTAGASFHMSGAQGFHQVLEGSAGVLQYRRLEADDDGTRLVPDNTDAYFRFGYGFGYGFSPNFRVSVVQDIGLALHERDGLTSEQSNTLRQRTIRLNVRYGVGNRSALRIAH